MTTYDLNKINTSASNDQIHLSIKAILNGTNQKTLKGTPSLLIISDLIKHITEIDLLIKTIDLFLENNFLSKDAYNNARSHIVKVFEAQHYAINDMLRIEAIVYSDLIAHEIYTKPFPKDTLQLIKPDFEFNIEGNLVHTNIDETKNSSKRELLINFVEKANIIEIKNLFDLMVTDLYRFSQKSTYTKEDKKFVQKALKNSNAAEKNKQHSYNNINLLKEQNRLIPKVSINQTYNHFLILTKMINKKGESYLTEQQLVTFIKSTFIDLKPIKQNFNSKDIIKKAVRQVFYQFYFNNKNLEKNLKGVKQKYFGIMDNAFYGFNEHDYSDFAK